MGQGTTTGVKTIHLMYIHLFLYDFKSHKHKGNYCMVNKSYHCTFTKRRSIRYMRSCLSTWECKHIEGSTVCVCLLCVCVGECVNLHNHISPSEKASVHSACHQWKQRTGTVLCRQLESCNLQPSGRDTLKNSTGKKKEKERNKM